LAPLVRDHGGAIPKEVTVEPRKSDDTVGEEVSAFGERAKGATKDAVGAVTGNKSLEREGERENAEGRARQATNNVMDETDGVRGATAGGRSPSSAGGYVTGLYSTPETASKAYQDLTTRHGYKSDDINVLMTDDTRKRHFGDVKPGTDGLVGIAGELYLDHANDLPA